MRVRQYGTSLNQISADHVLRYKFASEQVKGLILDGACGTGYGSRILHDAGNSVVGIDISDEAVQFARTYWQGPDYVCQDLLDYEPPTYFDGIVSFETLEHLEKPEKLLRIYRHSCHGLLVCSVPNQNLFPFDPKDFQHEYPHFRHYTPEEFDDLLEDADFEVVSRHCQKSKKEPLVVDGTEGKFLVYVCR